MAQRLYVYELDFGTGGRWHFGAYNRADALSEYRGLTADYEEPDSARRLRAGEVVVRWNDDEHPPIREALTAAGWLFVEGRGVITCPREP
jgi:hypothetical protein